LDRRLFMLLSLCASTLILSDEKSQKEINLYSQYTFKNIHKNIFVMHGTDSKTGITNNPAFIESKNGLILIDPGGSFSIGEYVLSQIKQISNKPIIAIFNTHNHDDHWFANAVFKKHYPNLKIYAHSKMKTSAIELYGGQYTSRGFSFKKAKSPFFADYEVFDTQELTIDGEVFYIQHPPAAHTNNDISISHLNSNSIFMGDVLMAETLANFGLHSSIQGNIRFLEKINTQKPYRLYIPGHGPSGTKEDALMPYLSYLSVIEDEVKNAYKNDIGRSEFSQIREKIILRLAWEDKLSFSHAFIDRYMHHIYSEIEQKNLI